MCDCFVKKFCKENGIFMRNYTHIAHFSFVRALKQVQAQPISHAISIWFRGEASFGAFYFTKPIYQIWF